MTKYQVIYCKNLPLHTWCDTLDEAMEKAAKLRATGYDVSIWEQSERGGREIKLQPKLLTYRIKSGMTQAQLAERSGVHRQQIHKIESGEINPGNMTAKNLIALADALGVSAKDLI